MLLGAPQKDLLRLQSIQNICARFVYGLRKYNHISSSLQSLHWLKVPFRVQYKILVLVYKCLHWMAPGYLVDSLELSYDRKLRSSTSGILPTPARFNLSRTINSSFSQAAPRLWNALPPRLRSDDVDTLDKFKSHLKTYLFKLCY